MTTRDILAQTFTIISGDEINMTVKKASTRVNLPPKQKHIKALHQFIQNPRANLVHLVDCFSQRFRKNNWMISLKALLTAHHLMNDSNQAFLLQVSRRPHLFEIPGWIDNSSSYSVDVSPRIVRYSKYLSLKSECFRTYQKDLTAKKAIQEVFTVGDIKQVLSQMEFIDRLGKSLDDTCIDFSLSSPIFHAQNVTLLREKLRVYSALNERMIFILKNLNELEASDAVKVIPYYEELCSSHRTIERLIHIAAGKGVDGVSEVRLKAPSSELVESLRDLVKEIIRTRGPPRLKKEWQVEDEPAGRNVAEKHNMIMGIVSSNTDVIPSSVTQDNFNIFWADQPTSIDSAASKSQSLDQISGLFQNDFRFNDSPPQITYPSASCRRSNSAEEDGVSLFSQRRDENNPPALSFPISSDKDLYSLGDSQSVQGGQQTTQIDQSASDNKMSDIDRLILENLKICENPYASSRKPSTSTHPNYSNPFL